ncbi:hypothetical protein SISSUDRAFT_1047131 [Sistotremastrum suecicum HHB10207 ss-3]|uniref:Uncharacterized protein n=1 Tax=Sistotremastrum suecicum HHB10207 ss-3 TaxID=1314776 RepID=A0A166DAX1_9AGAM|nr:hypothetical protein SISSUDRAFT_1047131 [Sistotremastrum suecicum HHB10207 ss-3]
MISLFSRYHESIASFAALATQSAHLSLSDSALYDRDHPSMTGLKGEGILFHKGDEDARAILRKRLGLSDWVVDSTEVL